MLALWLKGVLLGFSIAAPVGPIGLLCIRRTLNHGHWHGLLSGLGAASADALYGSLAAFGLAAALGWLAGLQPWLHLLGGAFIIWLGIQAMLAPPAQAAAAGDGRPGLWKAYLSTFLLTLSNPMTILSFLAIFSGAGLVPTGQAWSSPASIVWGVFCGSALWWLLLSSSVQLLRRRLNPAWLAWINRAAGAGLAVFGAVMVFGEIARWLPA
ncbi:MAG: LysE family transporter [Anaerolineaceae bacterium]|nr:LysE family transporter [Anaerolineaceae bacterium]